MNFEQAETYLRDYREKSDASYENVRNLLEQVPEPLRSQLRQALTEDTAMVTLYVLAFVCRDLVHPDQVHQASLREYLETSLSDGNSLLFPQRG